MMLAAGGRPSEARYARVWFDRPLQKPGVRLTNMYRVIRETHVNHTLGGERASGWIPRQALSPPRTPEWRAHLHISIDEVEGGYILKWQGPTAHESGDHWYSELPYAEHAAEELFGITSDDWSPAA